MSIDEFLTLCENDKFVLLSGIIRTKKDCRCPIVAVANQSSKHKYNNLQYVEASIYLGLSSEDSNLILGAADGSHNELRPKLLLHCGLRG